MCPLCSPLTHLEVDQEAGMVFLARAMTAAFHEKVLLHRDRRGVFPRLLHRLEVSRSLPQLLHRPNDGQSACPIHSLFASARRATVLTEPLRFRPKRGTACGGG